VISMMKSVAVNWPLASKSTAKKLLPVKLLASTFTTAAFTPTGFWVNPCPGADKMSFISAMKVVASTLLEDVMAEAPHCLP